MFVYFIRSGVNGPIKIGGADNPLVRMKQLQVGNPEKLYLMSCIEASFSDEYRMHKKFSHLRIMNEWFAPEKELINFINSIPQKNINNPPKTIKTSLVIYKVHCLGYSTREIADTLNCSKQNVHFTVKRKGISANISGKTNIKDDYEKICKDEL